MLLPIKKMNRIEETTNTTLEEASLIHKELMSEENKEISNNINDIIKELKNGADN